MLREARTYTDQVQMLLAANEKNGAEQVARAFQDLVEQRLQECLVGAKGDEKALRRIAGQSVPPTPSMSCANSPRSCARATRLA